MELKTIKDVLVKDFELKCELQSKIRELYRKINERKELNNIIKELEQEIKIKENQWDEFRIKKLIVEEFNQNARVYVQEIYFTINFIFFCDNNCNLFYC